MKNSVEWSNGLILLLGVCVVIGCAPIRPGIDISNVVGGPSCVTKDHNWDKNLPSASRFTILSTFNHEAVCDNNTGLVWEKDPNSADVIWAIAAENCATKSVGGTVGWRLPSFIELKSVQDPSLAHPFVPANIFSVQSWNYWSATTEATHPDTARGWDFFTGIDFTAAWNNKFKAWCVRGPMQESVY